MNQLKNSAPNAHNHWPARTGLWQRWKPLVMKELRETLRDTRTVGTLFLMPLLVYPLISLLMQNFIPREVDPETTAKFQIGLDSEATFQFLRNKLGPADQSIHQERKLMNQLVGTEPRPTTSALEPEQMELDQQVWQVFEGATDYRQFVSDGVVDLVLKLRPAPETESTADPILEMIYDPSREFSRSAAAYVALRVERYNLMQAHTGRAMVRLPSLRMLSRLEIAVEPATTSTVSFATLIPLILIMMTITGAVYPAIDLTAGERERGTLESLMAAPVPRVGILAAKYVAVWTVAMLTASLNVISMLLTLWVMKLDTVFLGSSGITFMMVVQVFSLLGLFAFFFSAILLVVTSAARSFKEAQAYLIPLMMLSLTPGALALMPNLKAELWMSLVPMVNLVVLARDVMLETVVADFAWLSVVSTLLYSMAALSLAAQVFGSDAVLYGSQGSWRELLQRNRTQIIPSPAFALLVLALLFPTQFVMLGVLGRLQPQSTALFMVGMMTLFTTLLFLVLPVAAVLGRGFAIVPTFALQRPTWSTALGGVLLGIGLWPLVGLSLWALGQWRAWMMGTEATAWSNHVVQLALQQTGGWSELPIGVLVICLAIVPAVCEEWFFRGLLLQSLRQKNREWVAIVLSGVAFGLFHFVVESSVAPLRFVVTATLGMILGWVCLRSRSLWPSILLHAINNGILTTLALSRESLQASPPGTTVVAIVLVACLLSLIAGVWLVSRSPKPVVASGVIAGVLICLTTAAAEPSRGQRLETVTMLARARISQDSPDHAPLVATPARAWIDADAIQLPKIKPGFRITAFATDALAHDIHCLAIGPEGEVFVAGPGYLRQLLDSNADGVADQFVPASFQPRQGAQGLLVERECVWVVADGAIWRVPRTGASSASKWVELPKTGGEHDFHSLKRGADGWLYFLAGNGAQIDQNFATSPLPIARPQAGVLGRISPDGKTRQVLVHGMRNAYDFDFDLDGSFLIYDSDDERDAGLPWYRPTTLFDAKEGADIGWVSRCFKKPQGTLGSAAVRAETGRGSPTGVSVQRSAAWGTAYFGAVLFADWTFGRVYVQSSSSGVLPAAPEILVESQAGVAFAPTSLAFDHFGRLWIATGGRDTAGAVYIIQPDQAVTEDDRDSTKESPALHELADWFAEQHSWRSDSQEDSTRDIGNDLANRRAALSAAVEKLQPFCRQEVLETWRSAGNRSLVRTFVLRQPRVWETVANRAELRRAMGQYGLEGPELVTWWAMAGVSLSEPDFDFPPTRNPETLVAMSLRDDKILWPMIDGAMDKNGLPQERAGLALAALAHRGLPSELSADQQQAVSRLFANDLQRFADTQQSHLPWADWLLIWRWALRSPVPNDSQTGPWDFLRRQAAWGTDEPVTRDLETNLNLVWQTLLTAPQDPASATFAPTTAELAQPLTAPTFSAEAWQRLLEIQLLISLDMTSLPLRWQAWFERCEQAGGRDRPGENSWNPIERTQAMVLLAAMPKNWPAGVDEVVVDYLLHVDRQLVEWKISTDRNWQQRFADLGQLLGMDHPTLSQQLADSNEWQRAGQIPVVERLSIGEQQRVIAKLLMECGKWDSRSVEPAWLDALDAMMGRWQLASRPSDATDAVAQQVRTWMASVRAAQNERFAAREPALSATELTEALEQLETKVRWELGDAERGKLLYERRNCQLCHGQNGRLGPALSGVSRRFQRQEILKLVLNPDTRITDRYRPLWVQRVDGTLLIGRPIYESSDGLLLEDQQGKSWQLPRDEIEWSRPAPRSLMPTGLMTDATEQDWADLWAYLATL